MTDVVSRFFKAKKIRSFQRQCHLWGFHRISTGRDAGSWWHESFIRGRPQELKHITRTRIKGISSSLLNINPNFYEDDEDKCEKAPLSEMNISGIEMGSFIGKSGSFVDKSSNDMSSVSVDSSLEKDIGKEFEHLDEEREAWFENTTPSCVSLISPDLPPKEKYHFGVSAAPNMPDLDSGINIGCTFDLKRRESNWNQAPVRRVSLCIPNVSSSMGENANMNQPLPDRSRSLSLDYNYQPDYVMINRDRGIGSHTQEDVEFVDEFSRFIDKTIHLP